MSGEATGYAWRSSPYRGATLLVHLAIADVVNDVNGNEFWMGTKALAEKARTSTSTVRDALALLVLDGYLARLTEETRPGKPVLYRFETPGVVPKEHSRRAAISPKENAGERLSHSRRAATPSIELTKENVKTEAAFDAFIFVYPRKHGRAKAQIEFAKAVKLAGIEPILDGAERFAADPNLPAEAQYIPLAATWLHQRRWEDPPLPSRGSGRAGGISEEAVRAAMGGSR